MIKIEDFTQFYQILALFYPIVVTEVIFREERLRFTEKKKMGDFTRFFLILAIFYPIIVTVVIFQRGKSQKTAILE